MVAAGLLRHPGEKFDLFLAIFFGIFIVLGLTFLTWGLCCLWGLFGLIILLLMTGAANNHLKVTAAPVDEKNHPELHEIGKNAAKKLGILMPSVYIDKNTEINAYTRGIFTPVVVLHQGLVNAMDKDELSFVMGHEMGHIRLHHFTIRTLFDSSMIRVPLIVYFPLLVFRLVFLNGRFSRSMEHSADRAGLIACGDLDKAVSCMIKLRTGGKKVDPVLVVKAVRGELELEEDNPIMDLFSSHPDFEDRVGEMVDFSKSR